MDQAGDGQAAAPDKVREIAKAHRAVSGRLVARLKQALSWDNIKDSLVKGCPLFCACIAPLSTLYDIPALSERWYTLDGVVQKDPGPNLALSALGLAFNVIANGLLVFRFSAKRSQWRSAVIASTVCWVIKSIIAVVNISMYGISFRNEKGYVQTSAYWCGVVSCVLAAVIATALVLYIIVASVEHRSDTESIRVQGRHFMLGELGLFLVLACEALIFSRLEGWTYFDGIYFSLVVALTIGYGDFVPTHTSTKILLFPFTILTVAFLASQVSVIVQFFGERSKTRRDGWRRLYEQRREQDDRQKVSSDEELVEEMQFLKRLVDQEERMSRLYDLVLSLSGFIAFWLLGALIYHALEGWSMGNSIYYAYVTFFTIGFGDFSPSTSSGRVFFVIWALIAVPLIASFAVQTVTSIWTGFQNDRMEKQKVKRGVEPGVGRSTTLTVNLADEEIEVHPFVSHAEMVTRCHERLGSKPHTDIEQSAEQELELSEGNDAEVEDPVRKNEARSKEIELLDGLLEQALLLELHARRLMLNRFDHGSKPRLLLQADKNLMDRAAQMLEEEEETLGRPSPSNSQPANTDWSDLEEIHMYRQAFARLLVYGTRLKRLEGNKQLAWERRSGRPYVHGKPAYDHVRPGGQFKQE